jgi:hypothetical protein
MKVSALQLFLRSLHSAVKAADGNPALPADLEAVAAGLEPFAPLDFGQFAAFLRQAQQFRDSGVVTVPSPASVSAEKPQAGLRNAAALIDKLSGADDGNAQQLTTEWEMVRDQLTKTVTEFLKPLAISVTVKGTQKDFHSALKNGRLRVLANQVRGALDGVTDETSLNSPDRQQRLQAIVDGLQPAELKIVATELGVLAASNSKPVLLAAIIERLTGMKPTAKKKQSSKKPAVDQAVVQQQAVKIKGLLEKSLDPGGLSSTELESAMTELAGRGVAELQAIAKEVGLESVGSKRDGILKKIRLKLGEADRARESIQV